MCMVAMNDVMMKDSPPQCSIGHQAHLRISVHAHQNQQAFDGTIHRNISGVENIRRVQLGLENLHPVEASRNGVAEIKHNVQLNKMWDMTYNTVKNMAGMWLAHYKKNAEKVGAQEDPQDSDCYLRFIQMVEKRLS